MRALELGVIMDPIESIEPSKDTTLALLLEAQRRGWDGVGHAAGISTQPGIKLAVDP